METGAVDPRILADLCSSFSAVYLVLLHLTRPRQPAISHLLKGVMARRITLRKGSDLVRHTSASSGFSATQSHGCHDLEMIGPTRRAVVLERQCKTSAYWYDSDKRRRAIQDFEISELQSFAVLQHRGLGAMVSNRMASNLQARGGGLMRRPCRICDSCANAFSKPCRHCVSLLLDTWSKSLRGIHEVFSRDNTIRN